MKTMSLSPRILPILLLALLACRSVDEAPGSKPALRVASDLDNPPFAHLDSAGRPLGRDVTMMEELARQLGRRIEWERMPFDELLDAAEAGEVDVVCATLGVTPERAQRVEFTTPYFRTAIAAVARVGEGEPVSLADLAGRRVAASRGTTSERALASRLAKSVPVLDAKSGLTTAQRLLGGEVDAALLDGPSADQLVAQHPGALRRLPEDVDREDYALVVPPGQGALRDRLDAALETLLVSGFLERLDRTHGLSSE